MQILSIDYEIKSVKCPNSEVSAPQCGNSLVLFSHVKFQTTNLTFEAIKQWKMKEKCVVSSTTL